MASTAVLRMFFTYVVSLVQPNELICGTYISVSLPLFLSFFLFFFSPRLWLQAPCGAIQFFNIDGHEALIHADYSFCPKKPNIKGVTSFKLAFFFWWREYSWTDIASKNPADCQCSRASSTIRLEMDYTPSPRSTYRWEDAAWWQPPIYDGLSHNWVLQAVTRKSSQSDQNKYRHRSLVQT